MQDGRSWPRYRFATGFRSIFPNRELDARRGPAKGNLPRVRRPFDSLNPEVLRRAQGNFREESYRLSDCFLNFDHLALR
jgi:hypothetical protein